MTVNKTLRRALLVGVATAAAFAATVPASAQQPAPNFNIAWSGDRLLRAANEPQNWLMSMGNPEGYRYSRLTQIDRDNIGDLELVWTMSLGHEDGCSTNNGCNIMAAPLVDNGTMYAVSSWQRVFKIDVTDPNGGDLI